MNFSIEYEQEEDGRWLAEVPQLPGVIAYGKTPDEAMATAEMLALRVLAEQLGLNPSALPSLRHEPMAVVQGPAWACCLIAHGLEDQTAIRVSSQIIAGWLADVVFAFHDQSEIGSPYARAHRQAYRS